MLKKEAIYSPDFKKAGAILNKGCLSFGLSVLPSVHHKLVSSQYLEIFFIEFIQILYVH